MFTLVGYWCGRLRDAPRSPPGHGDTAAGGRRRVAAALVGYSLIEFMLGVDAPVSLDLLRQIVSGCSSTRSSRCRCGSLVRRSLIGSAGRTPPSPSPRVYDRRSEPALRP